MTGAEDMTAQPITVEEQATDPQVAARLKQAIADLDAAMLRGRVTRAAQSAYAARHAAKG